MARSPKRRTPVTPDATVLPFIPPRDAELIRLAKVREARRRIESGYYDRDDVRDELAQAVLHEIERR